MFVASNFVSERGDIAILDDIEVIYESDRDECGTESEEQKEQIEKVATGNGREPALTSSVIFLEWAPFYITGLSNSLYLHNVCFRCTHQTLN